MAQTSREYDLVLLGATGYTGKLTAEWIATHLPTDLKWAVAGRSEKKLQGVIDELTKLSPDRKQPVVEVCELQKDQLASLAQKSRLIITTVGPYMFHGEPVLAACAENGTHYLDCTGEVPWYKDMVEKYHETAKRTGAIIIPQCGLDSVPADIMAFSLSSYIRQTLNAPTASVVFTMYDGKTGVSGGTSSTILNLFSHYPLSKLAAAMKPWSLSPVPPVNPAKPPNSSFFYALLGLKYLRELGGIQTTGLMSSADACVVYRSWGIFEATARDSGRKEVAYGPRFSFMEYMRVRSAVTGVLFKLSLAVGGLLMAFPLSRWVLTPLIKKFVIPAPGDGPTKAQMERDFLHYRGLAIADTEKKEKVLGNLESKHGAYAITGLTLAAAADVILRGDLSATEASKLGGGIVTPATLGEPYVEKLREFGVKIEIGLQ